MIYLHAGFRGLRSLNFTSLKLSSFRNCSTEYFFDAVGEQLVNQLFRGLNFLTIRCETVLICLQVRSQHRDCSYWYLVRDAEPERPAQIHWNAKISLLRCRMHSGEQSSGVCEVLGARPHDLYPQREDVQGEVKYRAKKRDDVLRLALVCSSVGLLVKARRQLSRSRFFTRRTVLLAVLEESLCAPAQVQRRFSVQLFHHILRGAPDAVTEFCLGGADFLALFAGFILFRSFYLFILPLLCQICWYYFAYAHCVVGF